MPQNPMKFAVPVILLGLAWKMGASPKEIAVAAAISLAAGMLAPQVPVVRDLVA